VPSPFGIFSRKANPGYYNKPLVIHYGDGVDIELRGRKLNVKDCDVFLALCQLAKRDGKVEFYTTAYQLAKMTSGSYGKSSRESIRKSLLNLSDASVRKIDRRPDGDEWKLYHVILYAEGKDDKAGMIRVVLNPFFLRLFGREMMTSIDTQFRLSLKGKGSDVAKQLYIYFQRQVCAQKGRDHKVKIGLEKLCAMIGLDRENKQPLWQRYRTLKRGLEELEKQDYLFSHSIGRNDALNVVIKTKKRQPLPEPDTPERPAATETGHEPTQPSIRLSGEDLLRHVEKKTGMKIRDRKRDRARTKALKIKAVGRVLSNWGLFEDFANWLKEQKKRTDGLDEFGWITSISSGTLDPFGKVFPRFMQDMRFEMPSTEAIDREFKRLTETEIEKRTREKREREERQREEERQMEEQEERERVAAERERIESEKREELRQWVYGRTKDALKDIGISDDELENLGILDSVENLQGKHPKDWRELFGRVLEAAVQRYREAQGGRARSYTKLWRLLQRWSPLWDEIARNWQE
jgi:hypothetical protein